MHKLKLLGFLLLSASALANATDESEPNKYQNWYQIEVFIFENKLVSANADKEVWPKNISLAYPPNLTFLADPSEMVDTTDTDSTAENIETASQSVDLAQESTLAANSELSIQDATMEKKEKPFALLPAAERTLSVEVRDILRSRNYRKLFHEAWRQPLHAADESTNIVISAGNAFADHKELEGTISISVSRYIHYNANLWITAFEPNFGQKSLHWPPLPEKPVNPQARQAAEIETDFFTDGTDFQNWQSADTSETNKFSIDSDSFSLEDDHFSDIEESAFFVREIVTINNKRRMRSGELHYIDHPKLGVLIKATKYSPGNES